MVGLIMVTVVRTEHPHSIVIYFHWSTLALAALEEYHLAFVNGSKFLVSRAYNVDIPSLRLCP